MDLFSQWLLCNIFQHFLFEFDSEVDALKLFRRALCLCLSSKPVSNPLWGHSLQLFQLELVRYLVIQGVQLALKSHVEVTGVEQIEQLSKHFWCVPGMNHVKDYTL